MPADTTAKTVATSIGFLILGMGIPTITGPLGTVIADPLLRNTFQVSNTVSTDFLVKTVALTSVVGASALSIFLLTYNLYNKILHEKFITDLMQSLKGIVGFSIPWTFIAPALAIFLFSDRTYNDAIDAGKAGVISLIGNGIATLFLSTLYAFFMAGINCCKPTTVYPNIRNETRTSTATQVNIEVRHAETQKKSPVHVRTISSETTTFFVTQGNAIAAAQHVRQRSSDTCIEVEVPDSPTQLPGSVPSVPKTIL